MPRLFKGFPTIILGKANILGLPGPCWTHRSTVRMKIRSFLLITIREKSRDTLVFPRVIAQYPKQQIVKRHVRSEY